MNVANWLRDTAHRFADRPALYEGTVLRADYRTFAANVAALAHALDEHHGIVPGDRVALFLKNSSEYLELFYAIWWVGAVVVPINCKLHRSEAAWIVGNAEARLVFTDDGQVFADELGGCLELPVRTAEFSAMKSTPAPVSGPCLRHRDDLAWLFYTSGTTGRSKGVMLSHGNLVAMSLCYPLDVDPVSADDACVYAAPMSHGAGLYNCIHVRCGARHVVPASRGFNPAELFGLAKTLDRVSLFAAPTMVKRMVDEARRQGYEGAGIKTIVYGGAPMYVADIEEALDVFGSRFVQIYGQGESPMTITALSKSLIADRTREDWARKVASVGQAHSCVDVQVIGENGNAAAPGQPGEVVVRGMAVMQGYWRNSEATSSTLVDGWLHTGDIGYLDEAGFLTLTDRSKDVIISGGSNIYPREIEEVLALHPAVAEVSVVGAPDPDWGEVVVAFVVPRPAKQLNDDVLNGWFTERMASFKKPKRYVFCQDLPKNSYGKILKTELRKRLRA